MLLWNYLLLSFFMVQIEHVSKMLELYEPSQMVLHWGGVGGNITFGCNPMQCYAAHVLGATAFESLKNTAADYWFIRQMPVFRFWSYPNVSTVELHRGWTVWSVLPLSKKTICNGIFEIKEQHKRNMLNPHLTQQLHMSRNPGQNEAGGKCSDGGRGFGENRKPQTSTWSSTQTSRTQSNNGLVLREECANHSATNTGWCELLEGNISLL